MNRRRVLALGGTALATTLAGCGSGDGGAGGDGGDGGDDATPTPTSSPTAQTGEAPDQVIEVGADGLNFAPAEVTVSSGATVEWQWVGDFHTVTVESQPEGENWDGTGTETHNEGYTHVHTFSTTGTYEYFCQPHRSSGMVGTLTVE
jgi:plastocyanin